MKVVSAVAKTPKGQAEGKSHEEALNKMGMSKSSHKEGKDWTAYFKTSDGRLLTRQQCLKEFGIFHSEQIKHKEEKRTKFLVIDADGMYLSDAVGLLKGGSVEYFTPYNAKFFSEYSDYSIGKGFGVNKPFQFFDKIKNADVIANFALHNNDLISFLKGIYPGKSIYGAGKGMILEWDRWALKKILTAVGMSVIHSEKIIGIEDLRDYLKDKKDKFVKSRYVFKGVMDTFPAPDLNSVDSLLKDIEQDLGIYSNEFEFIVEDKVDTEQEWGVDCFFNGEDYIKPYIYGVEFGKNCYIGKVSDTLPEQLQDSLDRLKPVLKEYDYRGGFATEEKIVDKKKHYLLDFTARLASPFGTGMPYFIDNWAEMVAKIGSKQPVKAIFKHKYLCSVPICSGHLEQHNTKIEFDPKYKENIKFEKAYKKGEDYYGIKKAPENMIAVVVNGADNVKDLIKSTKEIVETIKAYEIDKNYIYGLDKILSVLEMGVDIGIKF